MTISVTILILLEKNWPWDGDEEVSKGSWGVIRKLGRNGGGWALGEL